MNPMNTTHANFSDGLFDFGKRPGLNRLQGGLYSQAGRLCDLSGLSEP